MDYFGDAPTDNCIIYNFKSARLKNKSGILYSSAKKILLRILVFPVDREWVIN